jgi:outer membrane receptor protein involved in Fe transport
MLKIVISFVLCISMAAYAEGGPRNEDELFNLDSEVGQMVQSATLTDQEIATAPSVISVITEEQIRSLGLRTLRDALQLLPGVTVLDNQFGEQKVAIRGIANPNNILVTIDGERLNDFYDGTFFADLGLENIERIELIRGPGSALYGTNAFSGVISLYTKRRDEISASVGGQALFDHSVGWGARAHLKLARTFHGFTVRAFGSYAETSGPKVWVTQDNADRSYSQVPGETNGFRRLGTAQLSLSREGVFTSRDSFELAGTFLYRENGPYFGFNKVFAKDSNVQRSTLLTYLDYRLPLKHGLIYKQRLSFNSFDGDSRVEDQPPGYFHEVTGDNVRQPGEVFPDGQRRRFQYTSYRVNFKPQLSWDLVNPTHVVANSFVAGAEIDYEWLPSFSYGQNYCCGELYTYAGPTLQNYDNLPLVQKGKDRFLAAAFVQDQLQLIRNFWLTAGMRFDYFSDFGAAWNPRLAVVWKPHSAVSLKLLYGRAFRAPSFAELYDHTGQLLTPFGAPAIGNAALRPETTNTVEAGVEATPWSFLSIRANGFYINTSDLIDVNPNFNFAGANLTNYPGRQIVGAEGEAQAFLDAHNSLLVNFSYFNSTQLGDGLNGFETDNNLRFLNKQMRDLPQYRLNAILVSSPFARLHGPEWITQLRLGLAYSFVSDSGNNSRFVFEALQLFQRPAFHELSGNVALPLLRDHLDVIGSFALSFNRTIPVPLSTGWYSLPTNAANLFVGLRVHY